MAELGFVGDGPNSYQFWFGGSPNQTRLAEPFQDRVKIQVSLLLLLPHLVAVLASCARGFAQWSPVPVLCMLNVYARCPSMWPLYGLSNGQETIAELSGRILPTVYCPKKAIDACVCCLMHEERQSMFWWHAVGA